MYDYEGQGQIFKVNLANMQRVNETPPDQSPALRDNKQGLDSSSHFKLKPSQINFDTSKI